MRIGYAFAIAIAAAAFGCDSPPDGPGGPGICGNNVCGRTPTAPKLDSLVAGDGMITVFFSGGGGDTFYASCFRASDNALANGGHRDTSPIVVDSLTNGVEYRCFAYAAIPSEGLSVASATSLLATPHP